MPDAQPGRPTRFLACIWARRAHLVMLVAAVALVASSCGTGDGVRIAAASNLQPVLEEMEPGIEAACDCDAVFVFGSSGLLSEQIAAGAEYAVFLSADEQLVDRLVEEDLVVPGSVEVYATGRLAIVTREGLDPIPTLGDLLLADVDRIAIANPNHAPYGAAAREALEEAGVWGSLRDHVVYGENIRQATDYAVSGDVDVAIVALSLVIHEGIGYEVIPAELHGQIPQAGAVLRGTHEAAGHAIIDYLLGEEGQGAFARFGFGAPE